MGWTIIFWILGGIGALAVVIYAAAMVVSITALHIIARQIDKTEDE